VVVVCYLISCSGCGVLSLFCVCGRCNGYGVMEFRGLWVGGLWFWIGWIVWLCFAWGCVGWYVVWVGMLCGLVGSVLGAVAWLLFLGGCLLSVWGDLVFWSLGV